MYGSANRPESDVLRARHFDRDHYRLFPVDFDIGPMARLTSTYHLSTIYPYPLLNVLSALPVINDYGPFWPKRYQAVTGFNAGGGMPIANLQNYKMLSFLGTRYLMVLSAETRQAIEKVTLNMERRPWSDQGVFPHCSDAQRHHDLREPECPAPVPIRSPNKPRAGSG